MYCSERNGNVFTVTPEKTMRQAYINKKAVKNVSERLIARFKLRHILFVILNKKPLRRFYLIADGSLLACRQVLI